ncbi:hypothetical protein SSP35_19_00030 [Streptomyces sp. NBRC 110611]|uniref:hypothetical protein n=1 Tax=Streptomyces sp. NBRC 110611 TaxID=1621259 RepID=UPI000836A539|nr:hypothetical protein [Streptomyces sp. NBRC 110611]GAU70367.1 hypothetical protein SSP35_19_00030 [Streptomyces sp. NBRC 110611]
MLSRTTARIAVCALSLAALASGAAVATAAPPAPAAAPALTSTAGPARSAPAHRSAVDARAAAVDRCSYQVVRSHDSRYAYSVSGIFDGDARELKLQKEADVRVSGGWRKATQVDACTGGRTGQSRAPAALRVTGELQNPEGYDPSVPRTIHSGILTPAAPSAIPKAPELTSVERLDGATVRVNWQPPQGNPDQVMLMERKPFYISELGLWDPYTFQRDVKGGATSMNRELERDAAIPAAVRTHSYWMRAVDNGFVSDLRTEQPVDVQP